MKVEIANEKGEIEIKEFEDVVEALSFIKMMVAKNGGSIDDLHDSLKELLGDGLSE